jgi:hypothetical protein
LGRSQINLEAIMTKMDRLKRKARQIALELGHHLGRFRESVITAEPPAPKERPAAVAACQMCGAVVLVDPAAEAGGEAITGEAVLRPCVTIEQEGHETA